MQQFRKMMGWVIAVMALIFYLPAMKAFPFPVNVLLFIAGYIAWVTVAQNKYALLSYGALLVLSGLPDAVGDLMPDSPVVAMVGTAALLALVLMGAAAGMERYIMEMVLMKGDSPKFKGVDYGR